MACLTCAGSRRHAMHRLCPLQHVVCVEESAFRESHPVQRLQLPEDTITTSSPWHMVETWPAWYRIPESTRLWHHLGFTRLSSLTVPRVSERCVFRTARSSTRLLGQAERCCSAKASNVPVRDGVRLAGGASIARAACGGCLQTHHRGHRARTVASQTFSRNRRSRVAATWNTLSCYV